MLGTTLRTASAHLPDTDDLVGISGVEGLSVLRPAEGSADGRSAVLSGGDIGLELLDDLLVLEVPDLDGSSDSGAEPVSVNKL